MSASFVGLLSLSLLGGLVYVSKEGRGRDDDRRVIRSKLSLSSFLTGWIENNNSTLQANSKVVFTFLLSQSVSFSCA